MTNLGVLDLYRTTAGGLNRAQWHDAISAAALSAVLMLDIHTEPERPTGPNTSQDAGRLDPSIGNHTQVHQATGMVLMQLEVSSTEAWPG